MSAREPAVIGKPKGSKRMQKLALGGLRMPEVEGSETDETLDPAHCVNGRAL